MKLSLRLKLILLVLSVIVPLFLITILSFTYDRKKTIFHEKEEMLHSAWRLASHLSEFFETSQNLLDFLADMEVVKKFDEGETKRIFSQVIQNYKGVYSEIYSINKEGVVAAAGIGDASGIPEGIGGKPFFRGALQEKKMFISDPEISPVSGSLVFYLTYPLMNDLGETLGLLVFAVDPKKFEYIWSHPNIPDDSEVFLITSEGVIVVANQPPEKYLGKKMTGSCFNVIFSQREGALEVTCSLDGNKRFLGFTRLKHTDWVVSVGIPDDILYGPLNRRLVWRLSLYIMVFAGALIGSLSYAKSIYMRVKALQVCTEEIANGELERKVEPLGRDEIGELAGAMERMRQNLLKSRQFRQESEKELEDRIRLNQVLMDSLPFVALLIRSGSREIVTANKAGADSGAIPGKACYVTWRKRQEPCPGCLAPMAWATGKPQRREMEAEGFVWEAYWVPVGQDQYLHYVLDITERKRIEKQLIQAQKMEAIGQLAGGIAHDFNNILSGITGYTSLMKMKMDENHPFSHAVSIIEKSSWRAAELTRQLLGFARGGKYEIKPININQVVDNVLNIIRETFDRSIEITTHLRKDIWTVEGDRGQMEQILMNLCLNARDAMTEGGRLLIETSNVILDEAYARTHPGAKTGECVLLSVTDTGIGIPYAIQSKIFEPFFTTKEFGKGTGMGLAMVYGIVKNHEAHIMVYSEPGKGTCFRVYLPAIKIQDSKKSTRSHEVVVGGKETILLVDDEEVVRELGKAILSELGYQVILAKDGQEACAVFAARSDEIDLVLLDMIMPLMGGKETYSKLKEIRSQVKVLLSSGYTINGQVQEILREGVQGFVQKPYNIQDLARSIRTALNTIYP